jgi:RNA binding exosome subunit
MTIASERSSFPNAAPSVSELESIGLKERDAREILRRIRSANEHEEVDAILEDVDRLIDENGVEALHESNAFVDRYYHDIIALYVNRGESYKATLVFDTANWLFTVEGWADFYERWEGEQLEEKVSDVDRDEIIDAAARAFFVNDWADREGEAGRTYPGEDLMDVAPDTSKSAEAFGKKFIEAIEKKQGKSIEKLYVRAATDDSSKHLKKPTEEDFGYALAMQALGTGVAWSDDHPELGWKPPRVEFYDGQGSGL